MKEIHVVGAAIKNGDHILVAQRSSQMKSALKWEFAGGKVEDGETHRQALVREVYEELNIKIGVKGYIAAGNSIIDDKRIVLHVYEAEILEGIPKAKEHAELKWVGLDELDMLDWAEADIPVYEKLLKMYGRSAEKM